MTHTNDLTDIFPFWRFITKFKNCLFQSMFHKLKFYVLRCSLNSDIHIKESPFMKTKKPMAT